MGRRLIFILGIVVALAAVGAGAFYGGTVYRAQQATSARDAFFNGRGGTGAGTGTDAPAGAGQGGFGGGVAGTIKSIDGNTVQVSTAQNVTTVTLSGTTTVLQTTTAAASDLQVGQQVTVRGQRDTAGNVTATSITVVPAGATFGGPGATPTP